MPEKYIYEPWTAPLLVQQKAKCIIGKDYPHPVCDHAVANKLCRDRMAASYALNKRAQGYPSDDQLAELGEKLYKGDGKGGANVNAEEMDAAKPEKGKRAEKEEKETPSKRQRTLSEFK